MNIRVGQKYRFNADNRMVYTITYLNDETMGWSWVINGQYNEMDGYDITKFNRVLREGEASLVGEDDMRPLQTLKKATL